LWWPFGQQTRLRGAALLRQSVNLRRLPLLLYALVAGHFLELENVRRDRRSPPVSAAYAGQPGQMSHAGVVDLGQRGQHRYVLHVGDVDVPVDDGVARLVGDVLDHLVLLHESTRRTRNVAAETSRVKVAQATLPPTIAGKAGAIKAEVRIEGRSAHAVVDPRNEAGPNEALIEIVAEVVVCRDRANEQGAEQEIRLGDVLRCKVPAFGGQ
jgi:hypothetical protein